MGIDDLEIPLDEGVIVLVADNGVGKSSVLKGLRVAIGAWLLGVSDPDVKAPGIKDYMFRHVFERQGFELVRRFTGRPVVRAEALIDGRTVHWSRERSLRRDSRTTWANTRRLRDVVQERTGAFPLLAHYGARSRFPQGFEPAASSGPTSRESAYRDALEGPIDFQERFGRWRRLKMQSVERDDARAVYDELNRRLARLLPGVDEVWFDTDHDAPVVAFEGDVAGGGIRAFEYLSDGFQNVLAIGLDLGLRAVQLNPEAGPQVFDEVTGVVLIDEVAQHLHPTWQSGVVRGLRSMFPSVQLIVSTHSPIVALGAPDDAAILRLEARENGIVVERYSPRDLGPTHLRRSEPRSCCWSTHSSIALKSTSVWTHTV